MNVSNPPFVTVPITPASSLSEVQNWLTTFKKGKYFLESLKECSGEEIFSLTKEDCISLFSSEINGRTFWNLLHPPILPTRDYIDNGHNEDQKKQQEANWSNSNNGNPAGLNFESMDQAEFMRYKIIFKSLQEGGYIVGPIAKILLERSCVPQKYLARIWELSDKDKDGLLDEIEFYVAMSLLERLNCGLQIPESIPISFMISIADKIRVSSNNVDNGADSVDKFRGEVSLEGIALGNTFPILITQIKKDLITSLNLSHHKLTDIAMTCISAVITQSPNFKSLILKGCGITNMGLKALASNIEKSGLELLALEYNRLSDEGIYFMAVALKSNPVLKYLSLACNGIGDSGVNFLCRGLEKNTNLIILDLSVNLMSVNGIVLIDTLTKHNNVIDIRMDYNIYIPFSLKHFSHSSKEKANNIVTPKKTFWEYPPNTQPKESHSSRKKSIRKTVTTREEKSPTATTTVTTSTPRLSSSNSPLKSNNSPQSQRKKKKRPEKSTKVESTSDDSSAAD
jgi:hypothetical protein